MSFWQSKEIKKTRKEHRCAYCNTVIPVGSSCINEAYNYWGEMRSHNLCHRCAYFIDKFIGKRNRDNLGTFENDILYTKIVACPKCGWNEHKMYKILGLDECGQILELGCWNCGYIWDVELSIASLKEYKNE